MGLGAVLASAGCGKSKPRGAIGKSVKEVVKLPEGIGVFSSRGSVWKIAKGTQAEEIVGKPCWFPAVNSQASLAAFWEEHGLYLSLMVQDLISGETRELWKWNAPPALARNLNLRNAPCWHPKEDTLFFADGKQIWSVNADGSDLQTVYEHGQGGCYSVAADPEGTSLAFVSVEEEAQNLWVYSSKSKESLALTTYTSMQGLAGAPAWSPSGNVIAFVIYRADQANVWTIPATGGGASVLTKDGRTNSPSWDITGAKLAVSSGIQDAYRWQINLISATDGKFLQQLTRADTGAFSPSITGAW